MKTVTLFVGDKLKLLVDEPLNVPYKRGEIVKVVGFFHDGSPKVQGDTWVHSNGGWLTDFNWVRHYKKLGGK